MRDDAFGAPLLEPAKPRVLWICRWPPYPPLIGGDIDYCRELLQSLAKVADVQALAFESSQPGRLMDPTVPWSLIAHDEPARWRSLLSVLPNVAFRHLSEPFIEEAVRRGAGCDAIFIDFIGLAWLAPVLKARLPAEHPVRIILINHNHESSVRWQMVAGTSSPVMKAVLALDAAKATRLERRANRAADGYTAITQADLARFQRESDARGICVEPGYIGPAVSERTINESTPRRVCLLGNHSAHHKRMVLARALEAFDRFKIGPGLVEVGGDGDDTEFRSSYPWADFKGYVGDLAAYLSQVRVGVLADEIGGGFKFRALTYAFMRTPMVAVNKAMEGMGFEAGVHYAGVDSLSDLAAELPRIVDDFDRLNRLQNACFEHCRTRFDWDDRGRALVAFARRLRAPGAPNAPPI